VAGERAELLDARFHVVPGHLLAGGDAREVDVLHDGLVVGDHSVGDLDAEVSLCRQHGDPEPSFEDDLVLR
jgi:hypothetical protein